MTRRVLSVLISFLLPVQLMPAAFAAAQSDVNFKIYAPEPTTKEEIHPKDSSEPTAAPASGQGQQAAGTATPANSEPASSGTTDAQSTESSAVPEQKSQDKTGGSDAGPQAERAPADSQKIASKLLQGYIRVVPSGTKIPIIMDTAVDTDTSQEGDEFSARTSEDLNIDGSTVVPAGSVIKGRIAQLNAPRRLDRSGSVALKFDTVTTPDNRQIPIVANLVARGGVVHARRGSKDIMLESGMVALPALAGLGIGLLAGKSSSSSSSSKSSGIGRGGGAVIGAGIGVAVGVAILLSKKGKKVDVRPGDELKIELGEDLRMPM